MRAASRVSQQRESIGRRLLPSAVMGHSAIRWTSAVVIVIAVLMLARVAPSEQVVESTLRHLGSLGAWAPLAFGLIYVAAALLFLPGWVLTMAAGALFGLVGGTVVVSLASTTSAALAFLIARYVAREKFRRRIERSPKLVAVDDAIGAQGWKMVALLRLSPVVPFNLQNYLYGVTSIRFWPCVLASWATMLPGTVLYVYLGSLGRTAVGPSASWLEWLLRGAGLLATIAVTAYVSRVARSAVQKHSRIVDDSSEEAEKTAASSLGQKPAKSSDAAVSRSIFVTLVVMIAAIATIMLAGWATVRPEAMRQATDKWLSVPSSERAVGSQE